jgi:cell division control protein 24
VENFTIKFSNEEMMKRWAAGLDMQRMEYAPKSTASPDQPAPEFSWMQSQAGAVSAIPNPYLLNEQDRDDDEEYGAPGGAPSAPFGTTPSTGGQMIARNASSTSLRNRSATGDSTQSLAGLARAPPPRFPMPNPPAPLSLQTNAMGGRGAPSPGDRLMGDSYFSPVGDSPVSTRTSGTGSMMMMMTPGYPFPKTGTPQPQWDDPHTGQRYTAPAMPRAPSRDGPSPSPYGMNGRNPRGPSLPALPSSAQQQRSRSYSTPDINGQANARRNTAGPPGTGGVPTVPSIPTHLNYDTNIPRSQSGSPRQDLPIRANTQSPGAQRERLHQHQGSFGGQMGQFPAQPVYSRQATPAQQVADPAGRTVSPPVGSLASPELPQATQLRVRVQCDGGNYFTLVVPFNSSYQSLINRIDGKLSRFTASSIGEGLLKLRYRDEDGDFVSVESDDDIQIAFMEWRESARNIPLGSVGEFEFFCVGDTA